MSRKEYYLWYSRDFYGDRLVATESRFYNASVDRVYEASLQALRDCNFQIVSQESQKIVALARETIWSWGEDVEVLISQTPEGSSIPRHQLFDWGKSEENISMFFSSLKRNLNVWKIHETLRTMPRLQSQDILEPCSSLETRSACLLRNSLPLL